MNINLVLEKNMQEAIPTLGSLKRAGQRYIFGSGII